MLMHSNTSHIGKSTREYPTHKNRNKAANIRRVAFREHDEKTIWHIILLYIFCCPWENDRKMPRLPILFLSVRRDMSYMHWYFLEINNWFDDHLSVVCANLCEKCLFFASFSVVQVCCQPLCDTTSLFSWKRYNRNNRSLCARVYFEALIYLSWNCTLSIRVFCHIGI